MAARNVNLECKVYVGNLGESAARDDLENSFGKYGDLRSVWLARNPPGFAFVEFEHARDAEDAVRGLDGTRICGERVRVEMSRGSRRDREFDGGRGGYNSRGQYPRRGGGRPMRGGGGGRRRSRSPRSPPPQDRRSRSGSWN